MNKPNINWDTLAGVLLILLVDVLFFTAAYYVARVITEFLI